MQLSFVQQCTLYLNIACIFAHAIYNRVVCIGQLRFRDKATIEMFLDLAQIKFYS